LSKTEQPLSRDAVPRDYLKYRRARAVRAVEHIAFFAEAAAKWHQPISEAQQSKDCKLMLEGGTTEKYYPPNYVMAYAEKVLADFTRRQGGMVVDNFPSSDKAGRRHSSNRPGLQVPTKDEVSDTLSRMSG
jgi:hypothetical protein